MHRIDTPTAQKDKFGQGKNGFTRGNPQTGTLATKMDSLYFDAIQEEIANVIESVGIVLNKEKHDQLKLAIQQYVKNGQIKLSSATNSESETDAATPKAVKTVNDNANNAHNRINDIHDKFEPCANESRVYSNDKRFYLLVRDDGIVAMYNTVSNKMAWGFTDNGILGEGYVPADRILNLDQFVRDRSVPVGVPMPWPQATPPAGWFECNGAPFNTTQFPRLAAAYPSGYLLDLRSEFIRGWDNGRGADPGRMVLDWQEDAIRNIVGKFVGSVSGGGDVSGAFCETGNYPNGHFAIGQTGWRDRAEYLFDASRVVPVSHDNHPRNVAFMYIVKAE